MPKILEQKITDREARIGVVGLGYVGLPLAVSFAKAGFRVSGVDVNRGRVHNVNSSTSYITDVSSRDLEKLLKNGRFKATTDFKILEKTDVILICVPTPIKKRYQPDISFIINAVKRVRQFLKGEKLIVLESTTYPGTTEEVILPILESGGLKCNKDFYLAFSPERIDPGNKKYSLNIIPKVIGGISPASCRLAQLLYRHIINKTVVVSSARAAETVKLLENTFRIVNIGLINEMSMMAHKLNIDIWEIIAAAKTKPFGFMPFYPGPGVGGHCIPKDPLYLYWTAKKFGFRSRFIKLASELNSYMPKYIVCRLKEILRKNKRRLNNAKILIIGVTYKKDVRDLRKSPALDIINILQQEKARVAYFDPLIPYLRINGINLRSIGLTGARLKRFACTVIVTDHTGLDYEYILKNSQLIFDTRNVYKDIKDYKVVVL
jgi:UDP-N-acetyl-D-glucosamine dehydrogenase